MWLSWSAAFWDCLIDTRVMTTRSDLLLDTFPSLFNWKRLGEQCCHCNGLLHSHWLSIMRCVSGVREEWLHCTFSTLASYCISIAPVFFRVQYVPLFILAPACGSFYSWLLCKTIKSTLQPVNAVSQRVLSLTYRRAVFYINSASSFQKSVENLPCTCSG